MWGYVWIWGVVRMLGYVWMWGCVDVRMCECEDVWMWGCAECEDVCGCEDMQNVRTCGCEDVQNVRMWGCAECEDVWIWGCAECEDVQNVRMCGYEDMQNVRMCVESLRTWEDVFLTLQWLLQFLLVILAVMTIVPCNLNTKTECGCLTNNTLPAAYEKTQNLGWRSGLTVFVFCLRQMVCTTYYGGKRVLGLHLTGPNAGEMMQGFAVAIRWALW